MAEPALKVENAGGSDQEILDKARVTFTLAGREYEWEEPTANEKRIQTRDIMKAENAFSVDDPASILDYVENALKFFFKFHPGMKEQETDIRNNAESEDILEAFRTIKEVVTGDFLRYLQRLAKQNQADVGKVTGFPK